MSSPNSSTSQDVRLDAPHTAMARLHEARVADGQRITDLQDALAERELAYDQLKVALDSSRRIGAAVGIVMYVLKVTEDEAFAVLAKISQTQNRKLRLIADHIVLTGTF